MLKVRISNNNTPVDIVYDLLEIEKKAYLPHHRGEFLSIKRRFEKNKEMLALIYDDSRLAGYLCFFPVSKELHDEIASKGLFRDDDIQPEDVAEYTACTYLYIISVAVAPDYQNGTAARMLTQAMWDFLKKKEEEGVFVQDITAAAVTSDGERFLHRTGLEMIHDHGDKGYKIFRMDRRRLEDVLH